MSATKPTLLNLPQHQYHDNRGDRAMVPRKLDKYQAQTSECQEPSNTQQKAQPHKSAKTKAAKVSILKILLLRGKFCSGEAKAQYNQPGQFNQGCGSKSYNTKASPKDPLGGGRQGSRSWAGGREVNTFHTNFPTTSSYSCQNSKYHEEEAKPESPPTNQAATDTAPAKPPQLNHGIFQEHGIKLHSLGEVDTSLKSPAKSNNSNNDMENETLPELSLPNPSLSVNEHAAFLLQFSLEQLGMFPPFSALIHFRLTSDQVSHFF
jgi:hypothetical protein